MAESNSGNGTDKPIQKQNHPVATPKDSPDKENNKDWEISEELLQDLWMEEVINKFDIYNIEHSKEVKM